MSFRKISKALNYLSKNGIKKSLEKLITYKNFKHNMNNITEDYKKYCENNKLTDKDLELQRNKIFGYQPKISFVIPMYNTKFNYFKELLDSLLFQTYSNFEICLIDSSDKSNPEILDYIKNKADIRIKYKKESNLGISINTNKAIEMATGEYIAFCDHDDTIELNALYEIVGTLNIDNKIDFIYTDEDILRGNEYINPHFKPNFSPDLLTSYNYICHLCVVKRTLIDKVGMLNAEYDGSQDYDFVLRATEQAEKIVHIPKVLYHWRSHEASTAGNTESKLYVFENGKKAIEAHFKRLNIPVKVSILQEIGRYRVDYVLDKNPKISIVIANKDNKKDLQKCINSILKSTYDNYEIIIVENNSKKSDIFKYYDYLKTNFNNIKIINLEIDKFNYSKINNFGEKQCTGEYLVFLNNDTKIISSDWLENMLGICKRADVGIVGAKLLYPDNTVQHCGVVIGIGGIAGHINLNIKDTDSGYFSRANVVNNYSAVTAACMMVKKDIFEQVGGFDENLAVAFNDIDLCLKVREKGYLVVYTPYAKLTHYESKTRGLENTPEKQERFNRESNIFKDKWSKIIKFGDPYYNLNFRLDKVNFNIKTEKHEIGDDV